MIRLLVVVKGVVDVVVFVVVENECSVCCDCERSVNCPKCENVLNLDFLCNAAYQTQNDSETLKRLVKVSNK